MRVTTFLSKGLLLLTLFLSAPAAAQETAAPDQPDPLAVEMPGDTGQNGSTIRINRGTGFAPLPVSSTKRGVVRDASRPVTVSDELASRTGRLVPGYGWGVPGRTTLRSGERYYVGHIRHRGKKRWKHWGGGRIAGHRPRHRHGKFHGKRHTRHSFGSGLFINTGNVKLKLGF